MIRQLPCSLFRDDRNRRWASRASGTIAGACCLASPLKLSMTLEKLYEQASDRDRLIAFSFATPSAFQQGEYDSVLSTREYVFNSLLNCTEQIQRH